MRAAIAMPVKQIAKLHICFEINAYSNLNYH